LHALVAAGVVAGWELECGAVDPSYEGPIKALLRPY
jgi:hypothetical protein